MSELTHFDDEGRAKMVDVTDKQITTRVAIAGGKVLMRPETLRLIKDRGLSKGDVLAVARVAAIAGSKQTPFLIPMCHPLNITSVTVDFTINEPYNCIDILATVKVSGQTGVEMEALTAVSVAALTIYDMCKAVDKKMVIKDIMLLEKHGGRGGSYKREG
ncbi:MAG: cyclic pyranopterin monophosphate synthase MoaC [Candidatus Magnetobacterium sp. LHC-1]|uniref:Cyclic pyranopterin monophosphate synthase n=1 Tax=Candidatus Magnetobacterium casense TaxID=1455061 RepID=A0ABS6S2D0_9BACT|nr:cyclic pyranopterin monophosphate synthase MoaC [Candidatus Magnetobacterium casensis]MBF0609462.1 cyclic pyranopterin monophosphate synthase MoaC [Nitrospirota bacterium]MBV6342994.1 cyclic pyranopterin monophosphate synthase MoaC [Candidatus Magnetobacterium casensis]